MRKKLFFKTLMTVVILVWACFSSHVMATEKSITITSTIPNNVLYSGADYMITWSSSGGVGGLRIQLLKNGVYQYDIASPRPTPNDGNHTWSIPASEVGTGYTIRIKEYTDGTVYDLTGVFEIRQGKSINITSSIPEDGLFAGTNYKITWTSSGGVGGLRIQLLKNGVYQYDIAVPRPTPNDGNHTWSIPSSEVGSGYKIRIKEYTDGTVYDLSQSFTINAHDFGPAIKYGTPWNADSLHNKSLAYNDVGIRFRAEKNAKLQKLKFYYRKDGTSGPGGYWNGTGGIIKITLRTDDGSSNNLPTNTILAEFTINALNLDSTKYFLEVELKNSSTNQYANLTQGELYHIVFENTHSDPVNNFLSVNNLGTMLPQTPTNPGISDQDLSLMGRNRTQGIWKKMQQLSVSTNYPQGHSYTPIFQLTYEGGTKQGQGYRAASIGSTKYLDDSTKVRQTFTFNLSDKVTSQVRVRLAKRGNPGNLIVKLKKSNGEYSDGILIGQCVISQSSIPSVYDSNSGELYGTWVTCNFPCTYALKNGDSYNIEFSTSSGNTSNCYEIFPLRHSIGILNTPNLFTEGYAQFKTDSWIGWDLASTSNRKDHDLQFYFIVR